MAHLGCCLGVHQVSGSPGTAPNLALHSCVVPNWCPPPPWKHLSLPTPACPPSDSTPCQPRGNALAQLKVKPGGGAESQSAGAPSIPPTRHHLGALPTGATQHLSCHLPCRQHSLLGTMTSIGQAIHHADGIGSGLVWRDSWWCVGTPTLALDLAARPLVPLPSKEGKTSQGLEATAHRAGQPPQTDKHKGCCDRLIRQICDPLHGGRGILCCLFVGHARQSHLFVTCDLRGCFLTTHHHLYNMIYHVHLRSITCRFELEWQSLWSREQYSYCIFLVQ